jgi:sarcosine oxidase subunit delta
MKIIHCPVIGARPQSEFTVIGESAPEPEELEGMLPGAWVFNRDSVPMERDEWWYHTATQLWFVVRRHTGEDQVLAVDLAPGQGSG